MDEKRLTEIETLANAATPGPWVFPDNAIFPDVIWGDIANENGHSPTICVMVDGDDRPDDFAFIAESRSLVPELVAEVRRLRGELALAILANTR